MKKKCTILILIAFILLSILPSKTFAASTYTLATANTNKNINDSGCYTTVKSYSSFSSAYNAMLESGDDNAVVLLSGKVIAMKSGMVITQETQDSLFHFTSLFGNGYTPYTNTNQVGYYVKNVSASEIRLKISGFEGTCKLGDVILIPSAFCYPYNRSSSPKRFEFDYYTKNSSGNLVHYISTYSSSNGSSTSFSAITVDRAPSFMEQGVRYYSTDGYVYYADPIDAAREENEVGRHCIYYKNLSYRSLSSYTASELNSYIRYQASDSAYAGCGYAFITAQSKYGVNAAMELAFANHESAYGTSGYAINRYNFFGVGAVDSNPNGANEFKDAEDGILQHAKYYMNRYFFDAYAYVDSSTGAASDYSGDSRYFGTNPGNKNAGINTRYASDPFHGEKVAGHMYRLDNYLGSKDYGKYSIGMTNKVTYAYADASTSSWKVYKYSCKDRNRSGGTLSNDPVGMMVTIVGDEGDFYKVLSEMPMNKNGRAYYSWDYDHELSYVYVLKSDIELIFDSENVPTTSVGEPLLRRLDIEGYSINFYEDVFDYSLEVENNVSRIDVTAEGKYSDCEVVINNNPLFEGNITKVSITVTNSEGESNTYTVHVYRKGNVSSSDIPVRLVSLSPSTGEFLQEFDPKISDYTLLVYSPEDEVVFTYEAESSDVRVEIFGGEKEGAYRLYTIVLTSVDGDVGVYRIKAIVG